MQKIARYAIVLLAVFVLQPCLPAQEKQIAEDVLKKFVAEKDSSFKFEIVERRNVGKSTAIRLHLVSQSWKEVTWKHVLWIAVPNKLISECKAAAEAKQQPVKTNGLLFITGGAWAKEWGDTAPKNADPRGEVQAVLAIAEASNCPAVVLSQVPFQPMLGNLNEDALIAETFKRFILGQGTDWPLLMPMVRAASRAMDAAQAVGSEEWKLDIAKFTVSGASKRGWTTWLTSAVDPRVDALAPMVIDMLNMPIQMKHQLDSWGEYSEEIGDYTSLQLQKYLQTPPGQSLVNIVDPYRYRDRIQQPKLLIFGTNDRYWPIDACNIYWNELSGPKYLLYTPNQGHGIKDVMRLVGSVSALQRSRLGQFVMPELKWESKCIDGKMTLRMNADRKPMEVNLWTAKSSTKDFRNAEWTSSTISVNGENVCSVEPELPTSGYQAWFGEWKFENEQYPAFFSTNMILSTQKP